MITIPLTPVAPSQGWASALRDFRALISCDAKIPNALTQWILKVDEDQLSFLWCARGLDPEGLLLGLNAAQLQLIYATGNPIYGVTLVNAVETVRNGLADSINDEWAQLIVLHQTISDKKESLEQKEYDSPDFHERLGRLNRNLNLVRQVFRDQTGMHIY
jgi:hypothetical protein